MKRFKRTTLITAGCFSVLAGLGLSRKIYFEPALWSLVFLPALVLVRRKNIISLVMVVVLGLSIGLWRGSIYMQKLAALKYLSSQKVIIEATANSDAVYAARSQLEFTASDIKLLEPSQQHLTGSFKISGFGVPMVYRGDRVHVAGKVFPMRGQNQARMAYAQLQVIGIGNQWYNKLSRTFSTGMENALPEPQASFGLGLLIGQRTNLPQNRVTQLTMVGLIHIVAVSGYNLTILVRGAQRLKLNSKYQKTLLSLILITTFIFITGFSASIVRAAIVSSLSLWAWYLSFLAFFGVLIISPLIVARLFSKQPKLLSLVLIETLCAEIMTLPLIMMVFGQMSVIGLLANLLVVPLIPWAMLLASLAAVAGAAVPELAGWAAWPAQMILTYILDIVHLLSQIPSIFLHITISPTLMISFYMLIIALVIIGYHKLKNKKVVLERSFKYPLRSVKIIWNNPSSWLGCAARHG